jgi:hypothetical protein
VTKGNCFEDAIVKESRTILFNDLCTCGSEIDLFKDTRRNNISSLWFFKWKNLFINGASRYKQQMVVLPLLTSHMTHQCDVRSVVGTRILNVQAKQKRLGQLEEL